MELLGEDLDGIKVLHETPLCIYGWISYNPLWGVEAWDLEVVPPPPVESFLILRRGDSIFINLFLLKVEISLGIVSNLEINKGVESGMWKFFS